MKEHVIYAIINPQKTKVYVGESSNFNNRKYQHIYYGSRGWEKERFINDPMEEKNGLYKEMKEQRPSKFIFVILERCNSSEKLEKEKVWIELLKKKYTLYNVAEFGGALSGEKNGNFGLTFSEERKQKISVKAKERLSIPGNNPKARKVSAYQEGKIIREFDSVSETYGWRSFSKRKSYASLQSGKEYNGILLKYKE